MDTEKVLVAVKNGREIVEDGSKSKLKRCLVTLPHLRHCHLTPGTGIAMPDGCRVS